MCPDTAFSETPDSNQIWLTSLQAVLIAILASKLSTQLRTKSTGPPVRLPSLEINGQNIKIEGMLNAKFKLIYFILLIKCWKLSIVVML